MSGIDGRLDYYFIGNNNILYTLQNRENAQRREKTKAAFEGGMLNEKRAATMGTNGQFKKDENKSYENELRGCLNGERK